MANIIKGLLFKKVINNNGEVTGSVPFLPKTLARYVIRDNGTTLETSMTNLEKLAVSNGNIIIPKNANVFIFNTMEEYEAAKTAGTVTDNDICIIKSA